MAFLSELLNGVNIRQTNINPDITASGRLRTDAMKVREGDTFLCISGRQHDGHDFICIARERGAAVIVCEKVTAYLVQNPSVGYIVVDDTRHALAMMWAAYCRHPEERMSFIGVTGTNGKTSVSYMLHAAFLQAGYSVGLIGTVRCLINDHELVLNGAAGSHASDETVSDADIPVTDISEYNAMTTPEPDMLYPMLERMADYGVEVVILEASSQSLVQHRLDPIRFELGIFTGLSPEHLDYHGTMDAYFEAKLTLCSLSAAVLYNADDEWMSRIPQCTDTPSVSCSALSDADYCAKAVRFLTENAESVGTGKNVTVDTGKNVTVDTGKNVTVGTENAESVGMGKIKYADADKERLFCRTGVSYEVLEKGLLWHIDCPIPGRFTLTNTLLAASAARLYGISPENIRTALRNVRVPGRMERLTLPSRAGKAADFSVYIDYAHTPDALSLALSSLRPYAKNRLMVLFGCGGDRDREKRPQMGKIAVSLANVVILTEDNSRSENPRAILADILHGIDKSAADNAVQVRVIPDRRQAILYLLSAAQSGDVLLLAGKGHEDYLIDADGKHVFSEREIVCEYFSSVK